jgi:3,4-dihydroxy 2-butanone 4-phosphate synthase/GTP cyclohydrolase II
VAPVSAPAESATKVEEALAEIRVGGTVVVADSHAGRPGGVLVTAAEQATSRSINFMATEGRGLICVALDPARLRQLRVPRMARENARGRDFCVTVDSRWGTTTGISAADRAVTARALADPDTRPGELVSPGHVLPLATRAGGVLERPAVAEAAVDLVRLAGMSPAAVTCEVLTATGEAAALADLRELALLHDLPLLTIAELATARRRRERLIVRGSEVRLPTGAADFTAIGYQDLHDGGEHLALVLGDPSAHADPPVRLHRQCPAGDVFGSPRCSCAVELRRAEESIRAAGCGVIVYLRRGDDPARGFVEHLLELSREDRSEPPVRHQLGEREREIGEQILSDLGVERATALAARSPARATARARRRR